MQRKDGTFSILKLFTLFERLKSDSKSFLFFKRDSALDLDSKNDSQTLNTQTYDFEKEAEKFIKVENPLFIP